MEGVQVVYKAHAGLPCELEDCVSDEGDAFAKELGPQVDLLNSFSRLKANLSKRRSSVTACALIKESVAIREALGESRGVMRKRLDDRKRVLLRRARCDRRRSLSRQEQAAGSEKKHKDKQTGIPFILRGP
jgi:hypothetical protein